MKVKVTSAIQLSADQKHALSAKLGQIYGTDIRVVFISDSKLIGGLRIATESTTLDLSLQAKLNDLKTKLMG